jgi:hypothetical protein
VTVSLDRYPLGAVPALKGPLVYWLFDDNAAPAYVGATRGRLSARLAHHRAQRSWWDEIRAVAVRPVPLHLLAEAEAEAIQVDQPRYNRAPGRYRRYPDPIVPDREWVARQEVAAKGRGAPARDAAFLLSIDPDGVLDERERGKRLGWDRRARMAALNLRRWQTRQARKGAA